MNLAVDFDVVGDEVSEPVELMLLAPLVVTPIERLDLAAVIAVVHHSDVPEMLVRHAYQRGTAAFGETSGSPLPLPLQPFHDEELLGTRLEVGQTPRPGHHRRVAPQRPVEGIRDAHADAFLAFFALRFSLSVLVCFFRSSL